MVRKLALVTAIALVAALPMPMWNATRNLLTRHPVPPALWIAVGIAYVFSAILPVFYFAMWRNPVEIGVSKRARVFCLVGILSGVIVIRDQMPPPTVTTALSLLATLSCVVLLIVMYLQPGSIPRKSALLGSMTRIVMVCGVLWFGVNVLALFSNPNTGGAMGTLLEQVCLFTAPFLVAVTSGFR